jgi:hypothetical protein
MHETLRTHEAGIFRAPSHPARLAIQMLVEVEREASFR